jgi:lysophospholipid acyltransferase (LPLAT)-like uncharacterized protein
MPTMKIRHPALISAASWLTARLVRLWIGTLRYEYRAIGPDLRPGCPGLEGRYIYAFWHENMLLPAYHYARPDIKVLISQHADGQLIAEACERLGYQVARGSTTRGGVEAVRDLLRAGAAIHLAVTPDGPRGPRRRVQPGVVYLAARTGLPVVPVGLGTCRPWRAKSWDRFAVPRPWTRARCVTGPPLVVPAAVDREELERYRQQFESSLLRVTDIAERWAETGCWPDDADEASWAPRPEGHAA